MATASTGGWRRLGWRWLSLLGPLLAVASGCGATLQRREGPRIALGAPIDTPAGQLFAGEGRGRDRAAALREAEADARRRALESVEVRVVSKVERLIETRLGKGGAAIDERGKIELREEASGLLRGASPRGDPEIEEWSDGTVVVRVRVEVPRGELDAEALLARMLDRQAIERQSSGDLDGARDALRALSDLRPSDPRVEVRLARIEERRGDRPAAMKHFRQARRRNGGKLGLRLPDGGRVDLADEIDRLTPRWQELLARLDRLANEAAGGDGFGLRITRSRWSRARDEVVRYRIWSATPRRVLLLWIDEEGVYPLPGPEGEEPQAIFWPLDRSRTLEQDLGTLNGPARLMALGLAERPAPGKKPGDIERALLERRDPRALEAERRLRSLVEGALSAGGLVASEARFEIVP